MSTYRVEIPGFLPVRTNVWIGRHWSAKARILDNQAQVILVYARRAGVPDATGPRRVALELTGWQRGGNYPDADAYDKLLLDALVRARMLTDDSAKGLVGRVPVTFARGAKGTVILLEEAE